MLVHFISLVAFLHTIRADCETNGTRLGDLCSANEDCNRGECSIVHSKCSEEGACECTIGYRGENDTRLCQRVELGSSCSSTDYCTSTHPNSDCLGGVCACVDGYYMETTQIGEIFCAEVIQGTPCTPGEEGDALCGYDEKNMTCNALTGRCACPNGYHYIPGHKECHILTRGAPCTRCLLTDGLCYWDGVEATCACPNDKFSSTGLVLDTGCDLASATIGETCYDDGTVTCSDAHATCQHFGTMRKRFVCQCERGFVSGPEWGNPYKHVCHAEVSSRVDANCAECHKRGGHCYDIDGDSVHDACKCPNSRSTSDNGNYTKYCDTQHVQVSCDGNSMRVCYLPHNTTEFPEIDVSLKSRESLLYVEDKLHDANCRLVQEGALWCIDLLYNTHLGCSTNKYYLNDHTVSFTNWIILQRQRKKRSLNDLYMYVYCSYDSIVSAYTGHVTMEVGEAPSVGGTVTPELRLQVQDEFDNDIAETGALLGQPVHLLANITDDKGAFRSIKAEVCLASNLPDLTSPFARTSLLVYDGCPEPTTIIEVPMAFTKDPLNAQLTRSNQFPMFRYEDSDYVFFHCSLSVCLDVNIEACDPSMCARRRKRRSTLLTSELDAILRDMQRPDRETSIIAVKVTRNSQGASKQHPTVPDLDHKDFAKSDTSFKNHFLKNGIFHIPEPLVWTGAFVAVVLTIVIVILLIVRNV